jgi:hypothetical protein
MFRPILELLWKIRAYGSDSKREHNQMKGKQEKEDEYGELGDRE